MTRFLMPPVHQSRFLSLRQFPMKPGLDFDSYACVIEQWRASRRLPLRTATTIPPPPDSRSLGQSAAKRSDVRPKLLASLGNGSDIGGANPERTAEMPTGSAGATIDGKPIESSLPRYFRQ